MASELGSDRVTLIQAVQTPLGFIVLAALIFEGFLLFLLRDAHPDDRRILTYFVVVTLIGLIAIVVTLAVFRPEALSGGRRSDHTILIAGGAKNLPAHFDITSIDWNESECFLIAGDVKELVRLLPARVGSGFSVRIPSRLLRRIPTDEPIRLDLKDARNLRWRVNSFLLFENVVSIVPVDPVEVIIKTYGEEEQ